MKYLTFITVFLISIPAYASLEECVKLFSSREPSAYKKCLSIAEEGDNSAQKIVGDMYYWGWGKNISQNYKKAVLWYKRAAIASQIEAKYNLGVLYEHGKGMAINYGKAFRWYLSAARDGHSGAQFNLANMYSKGAGVKQSYGDAAGWYLKAAEQGDALAQYNIANKYVRGIGIGVDAVQAYKWYSLAAERGVEDAVTNRNIIKGSMTNAQIEEAIRRTQEWRPKTER